MTVEEWSRWAREFRAWQDGAYIKRVKPEKK